MIKRLTIGVASALLLMGCAGTMPELGTNNGKLIPCPKRPNCVNSQAVGKKNTIQPIRYTGTQQEARSRLLQILASEDQAKILTEQENYVRTEFSSAFFKFVDDVEFYFPEKETGRKVIHVRSASRVGYSDFGANRKRIERIQNKFKQSK